MTIERGFRIAALALGLFALVSASGRTPLTNANARSPIKHVFIVVLENEGYGQTFGQDSAAPYLAHDLPRRGVLLRRYYGTAHFSLGNYIAMISGQSGTQQTRDDCERFEDYVLTGMTPDGQAIGAGCVYPANVRTIADQLSEQHLSWRAYMEDMGNDPAREAATCGHPPLNAPDPTQEAQAPSPRGPRGDQYAARHNPFMYFHSIIDSPSCATHVVNLDHLAHDLADARRTPSLVFISPNLCHDGHDAPCKNGEPGGLASADAFLRKLVPKILASPAYRSGGLLVITFDEGETPTLPNPGGGYVINAAGETCCGQKPGPNIGPFPQHRRDGEYLENFDSYGGDRTGAVLLSPFLSGGEPNDTPFNHYSLLKTLEDIYATGSYLGYAGQPGLLGFFEKGSGLHLRGTDASKAR